MNPQSETHVRSQDRNEPDESAPQPGQKEKPRPRNGDQRTPNVPSHIQHSLDFIQELFKSGDVFEIRALGVGHTADSPGRTASGYFEAGPTEAIAKALLKLGDRARGVYFTPNPVNPSLLARSCNKVTIGLKNTTADSDIIEIRYLLIDIDPHRPSGVSSTDSEHQAALEKAEMIRNWLHERGWPAPIAADSGNGGHLIYRLSAMDLTTAVRLVNASLRALDARFSDTSVKVDTATGNPSRIWKLPGSSVQKGDHTQDRPYRRSAVLPGGPERVEPAPMDLLCALAAEAPQPKARNAGSANGTKASTGLGFDIEAWLARYGIATKKGPTPYNDGGRKWILESCPFNSAHDKGGPAIIQYANGALQFKCQHASCSANGWREYRHHFEPDRERLNGHPSTGTTKLRPVEVLTAADLFTGDYPAPEPIIDRLLYPGVSLLQGAPKEGKSYLALQAAIDLVNGYTFAGAFRVVTPRRVLYLALEDTKARTALRLKQLSDRTERTHDLKFVYALDPWPENIVQLDDLLTDSPTDVLIIDVLRAFRMGAKSGDRDVVKADYAAIKLIRELVDKHGVACLILSHTRKHATGMSDTDASIDSTGISAGVDTLLTLRRRREGTSMLSVLGRETEHNEFELEFDLKKHFGWRVLAEGSEAGLTVVRREIVDLLKQMGPLAAKDVAEHLEKQRSTVRKQLRTLVANGTLRQDAQGNYFVPAAKEQA